MNPEDIEIMLQEEGGMTEDQAREIVAAFPNIAPQPIVEQTTDELITIQMQSEPDWKKRSIMAASIIKMHLED